MGRGGKSRRAVELCDAVKSAKYTRIWDCQGESARGAGNGGDVRHSKTAKAETRARKPTTETRRHGGTEKDDRP